MTKSYRHLLLSAIFSGLSFQISAQDLDPERYYKQGLAYRDGTVPNYPKGSAAALTEAKRIFLDLAAQGNPKAMHNAAMIFYGEKNYAAAYEWFVKAAELGLVQSRNNILMMTRDGIVARLSKEQEAAKKAAKSEPVAVRAESSKPVTVTYTFTDFERKTRESLARNDLDGAQQWFGKQLAYLMGYSFQYTQVFLKMICFAANGKNIIFCSFDTSEKDAVNKLEFWEETLKGLLTRDKETLIDMAAAHLRDYIQRQTSFKYKLAAILFLEASEVGEYYKATNLFYDAAVTNQLDTLLAEMTPGSSETVQASLYVDQNISPRPLGSMRRNSSLTVCETRLLKRLSEIGNHWDKIGYADLFARMEIVPRLGDFDPNLEAANLKNPMFFEFVRHLLGVESDPEATDEALLKHPEFDDILKQNSYPIVGDRIEFDGRIPYVEAAIQYVIDSKDLTEAISLYRGLIHGGVYKPLQAPDAPRTLMQFTGNMGHHIDSLLPQIQVLEQYLRQAGTYDPTSVSGDKIQIQDIKRLTHQQTMIFRKVIGKESVREILAQKSGTVMNGGSMMTGDKIIVGGFSIGNQVNLENMTVVDGVIMVIANHFTLAGKVDALQGMLIIADTFDVAHGTIWNPKNCHFVKKCDSLFPIL